MFKFSLLSEKEGEDLQLILLMMNRLLSSGDGQEDDGEEMAKNVMFSQPSSKPPLRS